MFPSKYMNENLLTDEQRKAFADLIKESEKRYEVNFNESLRSLKEELAPKVEAKSKVRQFMEDMRILRGKLAETADGLRRMGFRVVDDGMISIDYDLDRDARRQLDELKHSAHEEHESTLGKFRKAIFDVWSAKTADEASEIVRRLM